MSVIKKTLQENYVFFIKELARIDAQTRDLPKGSISAKKIGNSTYYYHQWREGKKVRSVLLGKELPKSLLDGINNRKTLEAQRKEILDNINVIVKAVDTQKVTVEELLRTFSHHGIAATLIGSYCMPVYRSKWKMNLPTIKTQDVDFLIHLPYKGKAADIETLVSELGFSIGFNPDGSTYFSNGVFKIEFLVPEKSKGTDKAIYIKELKVGASALRYLQMLFDQQVQVQEEDYRYTVPEPWVFAFHKILIMKKRKNNERKEKDRLQAISILREVTKRPDEFKDAATYLEALPGTWSKYIRDQLVVDLPEFISLVEGLK